MNKRASGTAGFIILAVLLVAACGDSGARKDAGTSSTVGGSGGAGGQGGSAGGGGAGSGGTGSGGTGGTETATMDGGGTGDDGGGDSGTTGGGAAGTPPWDPHVPVDCAGTIQAAGSARDRETRSAYCDVCAGACCEEWNRCSELAAESYGGPPPSITAGCTGELLCSATCMQTQLASGAALSSELLDDCVDACFNIGEIAGNAVTNGWHPGFVSALRDLLECYLAAPGVTIDTDADPVDASGEEDAGGLGPGSTYPLWVPKEGSSGECFETCVTCSDDQRAAHAGCPVYCQLNPSGPGCL